ncbi:hypothetical protein G7046_g10 [Stylonectria norvegica]|nr:hypothetical protein G7046_g10 [Stylonectria norvegica]
MNISTLPFNTISSVCAFPMARAFVMPSGNSSQVSYGGRADRPGPGDDGCMLACNGGLPCGRTRHGRHVPFAPRDDTSFEVQLQTFGATQSWQRTRRGGRATTLVGEPAANPIFIKAIEKASRFSGLSRIPIGHLLAVARFTSQTSMPFDRRWPRWAIRNRQQPAGEQVHTYMYGANWSLVERPGLASSSFLELLTLNTIQLEPPRTNHYASLSRTPYCTEYIHGLLPGESTTTQAIGPLSGPWRPKEIRTFVEAPTQAPHHLLALQPTTHVLGWDRDPAVIFSFLPVPERLGSLYRYIVVAVRFALTLTSQTRRLLVTVRSTAAKPRSIHKPHPLDPFHPLALGDPFRFCLVSRAVRAVRPAKQELQVQNLAPQSKSHLAWSP